MLGLSYVSHVNALCGKKRQINATNGEAKDPKDSNDSS